MGEDPLALSDFVSTIASYDWQGQPGVRHYWREPMQMAGRTRAVYWQSVLRISFVGDFVVKLLQNANQYP